MGEEATKSKVLVVGGTGYFGRRIVKASLLRGHDTYILQRRELGIVDLEKLQMLLEFKDQGARLVEASFDDHQSLVEAVRKVDVVICAISGVHCRSHEIHLQSKLIAAIKEAGNVKRFLPSEFGTNVTKLTHTLEHARVTFVEKIAIREEIEAARIPYTYIVPNLCFGYFVGSLGQVGHVGNVVPPKHKVDILGDGNAKAIFTEEEDVATYTIKTIDDPRTLNKELHVRIPENILSQNQMVGMWEKLQGKELEKSYIPGEVLLAMSEECEFFGYKVGMERCYHFFIEGSLTNYEFDPDDLEATKLYPEVKYTTVQEHLKRFL